MVPQPERAHRDARRAALVAKASAQGEQRRTAAGSPLRGAGRRWGSIVASPGRAASECDGRHQYARHTAATSASPSAAAAASAAASAWREPAPIISFGSSVAIRMSNSPRLNA